MASLELQNGWYRIVFRYGPQKYQRALNSQDEGEARAAKARVEENLKLLKRGRLEYKPGDDLVTLLLSDGRLNAEPKVEKRVTLGTFFAEYDKKRPPGKEGNTTYTENIHIRHLLRLLGDRTALADVPGKLQHYVTARSQEKTRSGKTISHVTVKKELGTLTSIWNRWGNREKLVTGPLSLASLAYNKKREKPPFQTWDQLMRKTRGDLASDLWDSIYLSVKEVEELLIQVRRGMSLIRGHERHFPFVYPMFAFVAYSGCRRSEMLRAKVEDVDFEANQLTIREKKKDRSLEETYRHLPLVPSLKVALQDWLKVHPGGDVLFCRAAGQPLTQQMASHHFRWAVEGSKWKVLPGFHCLRHSMVSNLAACGVSDHVIMGIVGHLNRETTRRYLHLRPQTLEAALGLLFGSNVSVADPK